MTALALREDQDYWDANQLAVLQSSGIDEGVTRAELQNFLHECQRRKLDPFSRQIYLIGRFDRSKGRKVYRSQTSIDGFRLIARRAADKSGIDYSYEDTIWFDDEGDRHEVWLSPEPPAAAKVVVIRNGQRFDAVARYGAYVQTSQDGKPQGLWRSMPDVLIAKCAEGLALRKAFPEDLGGIYTEEEMGQADNPQRVTVTAEVVHDDEPQADPSPEQKWLAEAIKDAPNLASLNECGKTWQESVKYVHAGTLTETEGASLQDVLRVRIKQLQDAAAAEPSTPAPAPAADEEVIDGVVVPELDEAWQDKVAGILTGDDADTVSAEALAMLNDETLTPEQYAAISTAITVRAGELGSAEAGVLL